MRQPNQESAFEFTLLRARIVDENGTPLNDENPDDWLKVDALADAAQDIESLGRGRLVITGTDESDFVREKLCVEVEASGQYLRAVVEMRDDAPLPAIGELLAVLLADGSALVYEVLISAADLGDAHAAHPPEPDSIAVFTLEPGEAILHLRTDLGLINAASDEEAATLPDHIHAH
ncbi:hypothetical protein [Ramlibacter sp.]|uniref:hypothetical protein n=1 Tax=Ramlibacter sp. TaxID=1917967 RepID=UPI002619011D|nr:hypothetical protein [Ramlibacter sp.]MDB5957518.1 hypothetical protein [Ramlibacter sp.]